jgi:hypothetical protein
MYPGVVVHMQLWGWGLGIQKAQEEGQATALWSKKDDGNCSGVSSVLSPVSLFLFILSLFSLIWECIFQVFFKFMFIKIHPF